MVVGGCGEAGPLPIHWLSCEDRGQCLVCGTRTAGHSSPHQALLTMGTLSCDPAARSATIPLARRVAEGHIPETGLRKSCGMVTLENGLCWPCGRGLSRGSIDRQDHMSICSLWDLLVLHTCPAGTQVGQDWREGVRGRVPVGTAECVKGLRLGSAGEGGIRGGFRL